MKTLKFLTLEENTKISRKCLILENKIYKCLHKYSNYLISSKGKQDINFRLEESCSKQYCSFSIVSWIPWLPKAIFRKPCPFSATET